LKFDVRSVHNGNWSDAKTWEPAHVPGKNDRVLISQKTHVIYDSESDDVIRLVQVAGTLTFSRGRNTTLNVAVLKVQNSDRCSESGFRCDLHAVTEAGEPNARPDGDVGTLEVGTPDAPIPAQFTARIRLHFLDGMNPDDAPSISACSARMDFHGAPMSRTWVKLDAPVKPGDITAKIMEPVTGWRVGDTVIVTGSRVREHERTFRAGKKGSTVAQTEERTIAKIEGTTITLDRPLTYEHFGSGEQRSEVANLSRNVIVESATPDGVRGHTVYHQFSRGGISYARFAHLGKEGALGRYPIHFHLVEDTMRGSGVLGAAIVDSRNRWITIHGTQYLVVRDCVGYQSVGHGFFLEDGTEVNNLLDRNLGVQAYRGKRLPKQALPFDPNEGSAFWWANARNSLTHNVSCENDEYGYRYDSQKTSDFDSNLPIRMPDGTERKVDIRTIPVFRFEANEAHTEGFYGVTFAGNNQQGSPVTDMAGIKAMDRTAPDVRHPHILRDVNIWEVHYGLRPQIPNMMLEHVSITRATYGIYRPAFENHVYRDLRITEVTSEPFNRGNDDASVQFGSLTVDGLTFAKCPYNSYYPLIQISDNNPGGTAESHFRNVTRVDDREGNRRALVNRGGGTRTPPVTATSVPVYLHDYLGPNRIAKIVSTAAGDVAGNISQYEAHAPLTGDESRMTEVKGVTFPKLLDPADDLPPVTVITGTQIQNGKLIVTGISHDNGDVSAVTVNGKSAKIVSLNHGVVDWQITLDSPRDGKISAFAADKAGNVEKTPHEIIVGVDVPKLSAASLPDSEKAIR
jgi:hypothetical protein